MKLINIAQVAATVTLVLAPLPGAAQVAGSRVLKVPCCKCVDGKKLEVVIDTGRVAGWTVRKPGSTSAAPVQSASNSAWATVSSASWVGPGSSFTTAGTYVYEFKFEVPRCTIPAAVSISGRFAADNSGKVSLDNGPTVASSLGSANLGFQQANVTPYTITGIGPGPHTLKVEVYNAGSATGLALSGIITVACPRDPNATASAGNSGDEFADAADGCADCTGG
ncbi:MAG: hypothetical protein Q8L23_06795 [Caulobacter sp.]|nr:hypothetical protein [Caulobacter sp.]